MTTNQLPLISKEQKIQQELENLSQYAHQWSIIYLLGLFVIGICVAPIYNTWGLALGLGSLNIGLFGLSHILPLKNIIKNLIISTLCAIFGIQFIIQMSGLPELHFIYFISITFLIIYQDWKVMIPITLITLAHYIISIVLYFHTSESISIYLINYTELETPTIFFHVVVAFIHSVISAYIAHLFYQRHLKSIHHKVQQDEYTIMVKKGVNFAQEISQGNLYYEYRLQGENDLLGKSLLEMQANLAKQQIREKADSFVSIGVNQFGQILQKNINHLQNTYDNAIQEIVAYLEIQQAALFIREQDQVNLLNTYLELKSCYAYSRLEQIKQKIPIEHSDKAQDLISQAFIQKKLIHISEIPPEYLQIKSGLGAITPKHLYLIPLENMQEIIGVIELASLKKLNNQQIDYLKQTAKNFAITVGYIQNTQHTEKLLHISESQKEMFLTQEKEVRKHMEELETVQEVMLEQKNLLEAQIRAINSSTLCKIEFDKDGYVLDANQSFCKLFGYELSEIKEKHHSIFIKPELRDSEAYALFWQKLKEGQTQPGDYERQTKNNETIWLNACYAPVMNKYGQVEKVIKLSTDITENKKLLEQAQEQAVIRKKQELILKKNLNKLREAQKQTNENQESLSKANKKLLTQEGVLKKYIKKLESHKSDLNEKNEQLLTIEEELRQNMEELQTTYEAMEIKQKEISAQNEMLADQKQALEHTFNQLQKKNLAITDSINYAQRIQKAFLPQEKEMLEAFADMFIIYQPKDIVSGDFYWYAKVEDTIFLAVVDCTGHGVPGAFMSLIGNALLDDIIIQRGILETDQILLALHEGIQTSLKQNESNNTDGMDMSLCRFEGLQDGAIELQFSGAKNNIYYYREGELIRLKGDRSSIGGHHRFQKQFTQKTIILEENDLVYLCSDGILDSPNRQRKKFGEKRLQNLLVNLIEYPLEEQKSILLDELRQHNKGAAQRDDITLLGVKLAPLYQQTKRSSHTPTRNQTELKLITKEIQAKKQRIDFIEYHLDIVDAEMLLSYKGPFTDVILAECSKNIREKTKAFPKAGKKVFSVFMELAQNVLFYSKEVNQFNNNHRVGTVYVLDTGDHFKIFTGNLIYKKAANFLRQKCEKVNTLNREALREYKRDLRNTPKSESKESRGAGIGIVQATLLSGNPLGYSIHEFNSDFAFFLLTISINKNLN